MTHLIDRDRPEAGDGAMMTRLDRLAGTLIRDAAPEAGADGQPGAGYRALLRRALAAAADAQAALREKTREADRLRAMALSDEVTGLTNRRGFNRALDRALARARRHGERGLVGVVDLDGFKALNDAHGHMAGDFALATVATALTRHLRAEDTVARLGGDEFGLILPMASGERGATRRLARLARALETLSIPWDGDTLRLGASLGVAEYGPDRDTPAVLADADKAMYAMKAARGARPPAAVG